MSRLSQAIVRIFQKLVALLKALFGSIAWTPPAWALGAKDRLAPVGRSARKFFTKKRVKVGLAIIFMAFVSWYSYERWFKPPEPVKLYIEVKTPAPTSLDVEGAKPNPVELQFNGSAAKLQEMDADVTKGVLIDPPIQGRWFWSDDARLVFQPEGDWPVGQKFNITMDKKLFPKHVRLKDYEVDFTTAGFVIKFDKSEFHQDPKDPKIKKVIANLLFSHPVDEKSLEERIELRVANKDNPKRYNTYKFTVDYDKKHAHAYIHSEPIGIPPEDIQMKIIIDEGVDSALGGKPSLKAISRKVRVPGMFSYFRMRGVELSFARNEEFESEQIMVLQTTAGAYEEEIARNFSAWLLPKDKPATEREKAVKDYYWGSAVQIGPEILSISEPIKLTRIPAELEVATQHTYKYKAPVGRHIYVRVNKGTKAYGGYLLAKEFDSVAQAPEFPKEVRVMHEGSILSVSGDKKLSVLTVGAEALRIRLARIVPTQINHLLSQTWGDFQSPRFRNYNFSEENISEIFTDIRKLDDSDLSKTQYTAIDFSKYLKDESGLMNRGLFLLRVESWDIEGKYANGPRDQRFVLLTDLGVLAKSDVEDNRIVFVQSIATGDPIPNALVEILGKNGLPVIVKKTDFQGRVDFPALTDFTMEKTPVAYVIRKGADISFLPLDRRDRSLNYSRFDVGGESTAGRSRELRAFLFSDRGIYRPGDTFHVGVIAKTPDWVFPAKDVPVQIIVNDARGLEIHKERMSLNETGFVEIEYTTEESSPTGLYTIDAYLIEDDNERGDHLGSTAIRVEEFLPDRMRIKANFEPSVLDGWVSPDQLLARVELHNLFGTPAADRRVTGEITLYPSYPRFRQYQDYAFYDPMRAERTYSENLPEQITDETGTAIFPIDLSKYDKATYQVLFHAEGFEADAGRGVKTECSMLVSPMESLVGYKADGDLHAIKKGGVRNVHFIAVNPTLEKVEAAGLKAVLVEKRYVSVLMRQDNGVYKYQSVEKEITRRIDDLTIPAAGYSFRLPTTEPGTFELSIRDADDKKLNVVSFSVMGKGNLTRDLERNAQLEIKLDKEDYTTGQTIFVHIKAPYTGSGIITIERDKVYAHKWFKADTTSTIQTIDIPEGIEANAYVNVAFVRDLESKEIFMSPLSYGVAPFTVDKTKRTLDVTVKAPELARPGDDFKIEYSVDKPSKIVVFAVDEGILQVAGYRTPDPLKFFMQKRALEVDTRQILDLILPEYSVMRELSKAGGDMGGGLMGKNLNPFKRKRDKPVVFWSGIVDADKKTRSLSFKIPDYFNGTIRVMAVAIAPQAIGNASQKSIVRGPFVITPNVPLFVGPDDVFLSSVAVANNIEESGEADVQLELVVSDNLEILGEAKQSLKIPEGREATTRFRIKAGHGLGNADMTFIASSANEKVRYVISLSIRPPTPYMTSIESGVLENDKTEIPISRQMFPNHRKLKVTVSPLPLGLSRGLIDYLEKFPHGCTEQIVSQTVPALVLRDHKDFGYDYETTKKAIARTLRVLQARQNSEGAFGFWAANSHVSDFQTIYATQFLTEAKERGIPVQPRMHLMGLKYLRVIAKNKLKSMKDARERAYALYILARNGELSAGELAELREYLAKKQKDAWRSDLTAVYLAGTYELMRDEKEADRIIRKIEFDDDIQPDWRDFYSREIFLAQYLMILSKHFPERLEQLKGEFIRRVAKRLKHGGYNTLSSAMTIYALEAYTSAIKAKESDQGVLKKVVIQEIGKDGKAKSLGFKPGLFPKVDFSEDASAIKISSKAQAPLFYQVIYAGFDTQPPTEVLADKIEFYRDYQNAAGEALTEVKMGEEVTVKLKLRSTDGKKHYNVAIVDLLPGGFDVVYARGGAEGGMVGRLRSAGSTWNPGYADIREDRVVLYGIIGEKVGEFVYKIKATTRGEFTVPPAYGESMYDAGVRARSLGAKIKVVESE